MKSRILSGLLVAAIGAATASATSFTHQINDPALDSVQLLRGERPFVHTTNGEASIATFGDNVVSVFSASGAFVTQTPNGLFLKKNRGIAYAYSSNRGASWRSAFMPALPDSVTTSGFATIDVDRQGNFYAGGIGRDATGKLTVSMNISNDGGRTFSRAVAIDSQGRVDKAWLAVGPDPLLRKRDNVYASWVSFDDSNGSSVLRVARSIDGGRTFTTTTAFVPVSDQDPSGPQNTVQNPTLTVDRANGKIYVGFLQFGFVNNDYLRVHVSDDGGLTFRPLRFDIAGSPNPEVIPVLQPGTFTECGVTQVTQANGQVFNSPNFFNVLHAGPTIAEASLSGLPRWVQATRVTLQPALAVTHGMIHLAWSNSAGVTFGDPLAGANILYMRSGDGGVSWSEARVINTEFAGERSVNPSIALGRLDHSPNDVVDPSPRTVHIAYYTQLADGQMTMKLAQSRNRGASFPPNAISTLTDVPFALAPTNIPLPTEQNPWATTHYNRLRTACVSLGDYTGVATGKGVVHVAWGDSRNSLEQPNNPLDPIAGQKHAKEDIFHAIVPLF